MTSDPSCLLPIPEPSPKEGSRFKFPPLDGTLTIPQLYDWHLTHNANHPVFMYKKTGFTEATRLTYRRVVPAIHRAGNLILAATNSDTTTPGPVAIVATSDTITYFCTVVGMLRAGIPVVPIAVNNSASAAAHLLYETAVTHILYSDELLSRNLVASAIKLLPSFEARGVLKTIPMPTYKDIFMSEFNCDNSFLPDREYDYSSPAIYVHSSGSSSLPKPIPWTHASLLQVAATLCLGGHDLRDEVIGLQGLSMSHASGLNHIAFLVSGGYTAAMFSPDAPIIKLSPELVMKAFRDCRPSFIICVPSYLEAWSKDPPAVNLLKGLKAVGYGGGPLPKLIGDSLVTEGIPVCTLYGSTEAGVIGSFFPEILREDWEYFRINPHCAAEFIATGDGTYELVVVKTPTQELPVVNSMLNGKEAYSTNDLLEKHPTKDGYWRIIGRADDQITLSNGLKVNPSPIETTLSDDPKVQAALIFGRARPHIGVLIFPIFNSLVETDDEKLASQLRDCVWSLVERCNAVAPKHSHIFKEMILIASPSKPLSLSGKGTIQRGMTLDQYKDEIDMVYRRFGVTTLSQMPLTWTYPNTLAFVRSVVQYILPSVTSDSQDLLENGCTSLHAVWISNSIIHALQISTRAVPLSFVYYHPNVNSLSQFTYDLAHGNIAADEQLTSRVEKMNQFVQHFSDGLSYRMRRNSIPRSRDQKDTIIITGSTGALGSSVLSKLVAADTVSHVYALNRISNGGTPLVDRQRTALAKRGLDPDVATSSKVSLLEVNLNSYHWGLSEEQFEELKASTTHIIHLGWPVNFNLTLDSFTDAIGGVRTLIDFALSSKLETTPRLIFASSLSVFYRINGQIPEEFIDDATIVAGKGGYLEAKWIAERLLSASSIHPLIIRIGQLAGGVNGAWNTTEWFPILIRTSVNLHLLPNLEGLAYWVPLDTAASSIVELRNLNHSVAHLVHPHPISLESIISLLAQELDLPICTYETWMDKLEGCVSEVLNTELAESLSALKAMDFFRSLRRTEGTSSASLESFSMASMPIIKCENALRASSSLREVRQLGSEDIKSWLGYWRGEGLL